MPLAPAIAGTKAPRQALPAAEQSAPASLPKGAGARAALAGVFSPLGSSTPGLHSPRAFLNRLNQLPYRSELFDFREIELNIERVLWSDKVYVVPRNDGRVLVGATVEYVGFEKNITAGGVQTLLHGAIDLVSGLAGAILEETWAGLRPDSPDHLPIIGATDVEGLLIATGHFRSGILLAPITARLIRDWITKESVGLDWERFSPMRFAEFGKATNL